MTWCLISSWPLIFDIRSWPLIFDFRGRILEVMTWYLRSRFSQISEVMTSDQISNDLIKYQRSYLWYLTFDIKYQIFFNNIRGHDQYQRSYQRFYGLCLHFAFNIISGHDQTSNIRPQISDLWYQTSDIKYQTSNIEYQTSNIRPQISDLWYHDTDIIGLYIYIYHRSLYIS